MEKRVSVESVREGPERIDVLIVAWDKQEIEGNEQEVPLGEKAMSFPTGTKPAAMVKSIKAAAAEIEAAADKAKKTREELNRLLEKKDQPE